MKNLKQTRWHKSIAIADLLMEKLSKGDFRAAIAVFQEHV